MARNEETASAVSLVSQSTLKEWLKPGDTVYSILRHVSQSGMTRHISLVIVRDGEIRDITWNASKVLGWRLAKGNDFALVVGGAGMDMGFHTVYSLASALFADGYALNNRWL